MRRVLVTGSSGYIGSVLMDYLAEHGIDSIGYDPGFFKPCLLYAPSSSTTISGDARDITDADLDGIDTVVHLAGISNDPMGKMDAAQVYDPTRAYSLEIAKRCKRLGVRFIFASSCENLPIILLEAMASHLPIACSNRLPMPEVLGDTGVYFDPEDITSITNALRELLVSSELRKVKAKKAKERSIQYTWGRCANDTFEFLSACI